MADYTLKNLTEAENMAEKFGYDEFQEARFPAKDLEAEATGLALIKVKPGQRQPFAHHHDDAEEIYVVIQGNGRIKLDDELVDLGPMDAIRIAPAVTRSLEAGPDGMEVLAFGPHHESDGEIIKDFWAD